MLSPGDIHPEPAVCSYQLNKDGIANGKKQNFGFAK
jgi:hypothetical protein